MRMRITEKTVRRLIREVFIGSEPGDESSTPQVLRRTEPVAKAKEAPAAQLGGREEFESAGYKYAWLPDKEQFLIK